MVKKLILFSLIILRIQISLQQNNIQCVDEDNNPVDWVMMYKLPKIHWSRNPKILNGEAYMYITSKYIEQIRYQNHYETNLKIDQILDVFENEIDSDHFKFKRDLNHVQNKRHKKNKKNKHFHKHENIDFEFMEFYKNKNTNGLSGNDWILSNYSINDPESLPSKILSPILFNENAKKLFEEDGVKILYNDQTPSSTTVTFGHSKGIVLGNSQGGVWIVHSVPHFIDDSKNVYNYPHTGLMYGQSFLCLSLDSKTLNNIGNNLGHNQVYIFSKYISDINKQTYPVLNKVINGQYVIDGDMFYKNVIYTKYNNYRFTSFAKPREFHDDLYKYIAMSLNVDLFVETWPNGPGRLPSNCKNPKSKVENIKAINITNILNFPSTKDHSKWTISTDVVPADNKYYVCNGDINRAEDQLKRGGGSVCIDNDIVWKLYNNIISIVEPCPKPTILDFYKF